MRSNVIILLTLSKLLLINPSVAVKFQSKDEWDCISQLLLEERYMRVLLTMDDSSCDPELDFGMLMDKVESRLRETLIDDNPYIKDIITHHVGGTEVIPQSIIRPGDEKQPFEVLDTQELIKDPTNKVDSLKTEEIHNPTHTNEKYQPKVIIDEGTDVKNNVTNELKIDVNKTGAIIINIQKITNTYVPQEEIHKDKDIVINFGEFEDEDEEDSPELLNMLNLLIARRNGFSTNVKAIDETPIHNIQQEIKEEQIINDIPAYIENSELGKHEPHDQKNVILPLDDKIIQEKLPNDIDTTNTVDINAHELEDAKKGNPLVVDIKTNTTKNIKVDHVYEKEPVSIVLHFNDSDSSEDSEDESNAREQSNSRIIESKKKNDIVKPLNITPIINQTTIKELEIDENEPQIKLDIKKKTLPSIEEHQDIEIPINELDILPIIEKHQDEKIPINKLDTLPIITDPRIEQYTEIINKNIPETNIIIPDKSESKDSKSESSSSSESKDSNLTSSDSEEDSTKYENISPVGTSKKNPIIENSIKIPFKGDLNKKRDDINNTVRDFIQKEVIINDTQEQLVLDETIEEKEEIAPKIDNITIPDNVDISSEEDVIDKDPQIKINDKITSLIKNVSNDSEEEVIIDKQLIHNNKDNIVDTVVDKESSESIDEEVIDTNIVPELKPEDLDIINKPTIKDLAPLVHHDDKTQLNGRNPAINVNIINHKIEREDKLPENKNYIGIASMQFSDEEEPENQPIKIEIKPKTKPFVEPLITETDKIIPEIKEDEKKNPHFDYYIIPPSNIIIPIDNQNEIEMNLKPQGPIIIPEIDLTKNDSSKGSGRTMIAVQTIKNRRNLELDTRTKEEVLAEIMRLFLMLPKCIQAALMKCKPRMDFVKTACEKNYNNTKNCRVWKLSARITCDKDETLINDTCYKNCPETFTDKGLFCLKREYILRDSKTKTHHNELNNDEEMYGDSHIVTKCSHYGNYYEPVGLQYCRPVCPPGFKDRGILCEKPYRYARQNVFTITNQHMKDFDI